MHRPDAIRLTHTHTYDVYMFATQDTDEQEWQIWGYCDSDGGPFHYPSVLSDNPALLASYPLNDFDTADAVLAAFIARDARYAPAR